jgi:hypothetical protein
MTTTTRRRPRLTQPEEMPAPVVDDLSATVLGEAIDALAAIRTPYWLGDPAARLHALASCSNRRRRCCPAPSPRPATWT